MGMDAELLAIGKFTPEIANYLDYPGHYYNDTPVGSTIITFVANCVTSAASEMLAEALGISPWKFHEHCELDGRNVNQELLQEAAEDGAHALLRFEVLKRHNFRFYYLPNG